MDTKFQYRDYPPARNLDIAVLVFTIALFGTGVLAHLMGWRFVTGFVCTMLAVQSIIIFLSLVQILFDDPK